MPRRRHPLARALLRVAASLPLTRGRWALLRRDSAAAVRAFERALGYAPETFDVLLHLARADLRGATGYAIHPGENDVRGLRVSMPDALSLLLSLGVVVEV